MITVSHFLFSKMLLSSAYYNGWMSVLDQLNYDYSVTFWVSSVLISCACKKNGLMSVPDQLDHNHCLTFPLLFCVAFPIHQDVAFLCLLERLYECSWLAETQPLPRFSSFIFHVSALKDAKVRDFWYARIYMIFTPCSLYGGRLNTKVYKYFLGVHLGAQSSLCICSM